MVKPKAPCQGCGDRRTGCHGKCEAYKAYKLKNAEYNRWKEAKQTENDVDKYIIETFEKQARWKLGYGVKRRKKR